MRELTLGSLFDGLGGWLLAAKENDIRPIWSSEIDDFPMAVSKYHFPEVQQLGDITKLDGAKLTPVDIICSGAPCQGNSVAGKRGGLKDERSGLFFESIRIAKEMQKATNMEYPKFFVYENVPGLFSTNKGSDIQSVYDSFEELGMVLDVNLLDAQFMGVPQRRKRIFCIGMGVDYIRKMRTNTSKQIITQLLVEILLCTLAGQLNLLEKGRKNSIWKERRLSEDGLRKKMKLFKIEEMPAYEQLLKDWIEICQIYPKEQLNSGVHLGKLGGMSIQAAIEESDCQGKMAKEKLCMSMLPLWNIIWDGYLQKVNACTILTETNSTTPSIIYSCANLLESIIESIGHIGNYSRIWSEMGTYILTARRECIKYANEQQKHGDIFSTMEWIPDWTNYLERCANNRLEAITGLGANSRPEVLFESESLSGDTKASKDEGKGAARDTTQSTDKTSWAFEPGITDGRKLTQDKSTTLRANMGDNQTAVVYGIGSYDSNAMKSQNPNSGIYKADTSRTLDVNCGNPACNQGGMAVVSMGHDERSAGFIPNIADHLTASDYKQPPVVACIGNGQCNQLSLQDKMGALNCMHDQQAVLIGSKPASDENTCRLANGKDTALTAGQSCLQATKRLSVAISM